ncbi:tetraacyldisaccharide 4'-kinase [Flavihumibacter sp. CACIAM 22H1]|uniref:tetraacyldisaccharide 4'-kinase n=1 Tax=Flavihumibacter sp. CACIAM 22H1 TaxID=1812911 RepID=UPI0007A8F080|nr:tetraacyldisaccharide 4'-kinase [Flavihumibacter sp. CACIAM 22H1]KYP13532.1 MAG: tetraacyldisaccharide 4'-kinase [Flavihumibacter sp. CACIAM 22H1]
MNFNFPLLKPLRILLFPFSFLYWCAIFIRNKLYDWKLLKAARFNIPIICVGNIAAGGTGKSPMVEWLLREFGREFKMATLSRGYKRKTRGYALANTETTALEIGDEPMQFHLKFPHVSVAVGEERVVAVPLLLQDRPETELIVLDDAFQHRAIEAGLNIVLTDYSNLYTRDWYLPTGDLRDEKRSCSRANLLVVTKCPAGLSEAEAKKIEDELSPSGSQELFFASIAYGTPYQLVTRQEIELEPDMEVLLVTGIANPKPLKRLLSEKVASYEQMVFSDHHIFTIDDIKEIERRFNQLGGTKKILLTTEKDAVRLMKFQQDLVSWSLYVVPIEMVFLFNKTDRFKSIIGKFSRQFSGSATH